MSALVFPRARELSWQRVPIPAEAAGQVLVRIERLGICGTDVDLYTRDITYMKNGCRHSRSGRATNGAAPSSPSPRE